VAGGGADEQQGLPARYGVDYGGHDFRHPSRQDIVYLVDIVVVVAVFGGAEAELAQLLIALPVVGAGLLSSAMVHFLSSKTTLFDCGDRVG
jgi:hypothetical protein